MAKKVCLIDGSGYIFRAFYALPPLNTQDGTPVNAVLGFMNMFMRLTAKIKCDYCLVLFDAKRQNYRNEIFADYKGTRKEIPEELIPQFPIIHQAVEVLNLNHLEMEGFEADDLIATYARKALEEGDEVVVVSADKDLMQLIRPGVEFYDSMKDKFFTPEDVKEKFGVYPDRVVDVQALAGDATDNVPGVPGIGLKTAAELVNQFGSLDEVLNHADEIKQITKENYNATVSLLSERENRRKAKSGYRGFIAFSPGYYISGTDAYEISTTHGFQVNHNIFVGGGIGLDIIGLSYQTDMVAIPVYTAFNGNVGSRVAQFTYGTRLGCSFVDGHVPFMWNVNIGLRLGFTPTFGLSITPDFSLLAGSNFFDARIGLRIGIDI